MTDNVQTEMFYFNKLKLFSNNFVLLVLKFCKCLARYREVKN